TFFILSQVEWNKSEDWSQGRGATQAVAIGQSSGDGDPPVVAYPSVSIDPMRLVETVSVNSDDETVLLGEAQRKWAELSSGTTVYDVSLVVADSDILLGRDVALGDDVTVDLANPDCPDQDHSFDARLVGWTAEPDPDSGQITILKPILVNREA